MQPIPMPLSSKVPSCPATAPARAPLNNPRTFPTPRHRPSRRGIACLHRASYRRNEKHRQRHGRGVGNDAWLHAHGCFPSGTKTTPRRFQDISVSQLQESRGFSGRDHCDRASESNLYAAALDFGSRREKGKSPHLRKRPVHADHPAHGPHKYPGYKLACASASSSPTTFPGRVFST